MHIACMRQHVSGKYKSIFESGNTVSEIIKTTLSHKCSETFSETQSTTGNARTPELKLEPTAGEPNGLRQNPCQIFWVQWVDVQAKIRMFTSLIIILLSNLWLDAPPWSQYFLGALTDRCYDHSLTETLRDRPLTRHGRQSKTREGQTRSRGKAEGAGRQRREGGRKDPRPSKAPEEKQQNQQRLVHPLLCLILFQREERDKRQEDDRSLHQ